MKTIKQVWVLMLFLACTNFVNGQIQVGITAGFGGATQSELGDLYNNNDIIVGLNGGLMIKESLSDNFAIDAELLYAAKGSSFEVFSGVRQVDQKNKFSYLEIPLKAEYSIPINNNSFYMASGPYFGILLDAKQEIDGATTDIKDETENLDFGWVFELGFSKTISERDLRFSISYDMGLTKVTDFDEDIRNKSLVFNIGFLF